MKISFSKLALNLEKAESFSLEEEEQRQTKAQEQFQRVVFDAGTLKDIEDIPDAVIFSMLENIDVMLGYPSQLEELRQSMAESFFKKKMCLNPRVL